MTKATPAAAAKEAQLPQYQCHKIVGALRIDTIKRVKNEGADDSWHLVPLDPGHEPVNVDADWFTKHQPQAGGYYVLYEDGYSSYSPAKAFEAGYKPLKAPK